MEKKRQTVCFAYYGDGKFIGWYADSFGSIRDNSPKLYGYSESQVNIIATNLKYKLSKLKQESDFAKSDSRLKILDNSLDEDKRNLSQYKVVELRIVECPIYDGPNPDFDAEAYQLLVDARHEAMTKAGIFDIPAPSIARIEAIKEFDKTYNMPERNSWIYADYKAVQEWALTEPKEFLGTLVNE